MHLAAESHVDRSIDGPGTFIDTNITGTYTLLEAARAYWTAEGKPDSFRFHHISTDEVFGTLGDTGLFTEETPYAPNSPYSASKAASDHLVRAWHETYGLPVVLTNCSNNYGPYHFPEKLIPVVILNALAGKPIPVYGQGFETCATGFMSRITPTPCCSSAKRGPWAAATTSAATTSVATSTSCAPSAPLLDERRPTGAPHDRLITYVTDRPGHDLRYAHRRRRASPRSWAGSPPSRSRRGLARTVDWYLANEAWWRALQARDGVGERLGKGGVGGMVDAPQDQGRVRGMTRFSASSSSPPREGRRLLRQRFASEAETRKVDVDWKATPYSRIALVNRLAWARPESRYLEIGCDDDLLFHSVPLDKKIGVDPIKGGTHRMTSDDFFAANTDRYDIIFIDGLHTYEQVRHDVINAMGALAPGGWIALHDMVPRTWEEEHVPRVSGAWTGDVWKVAIELSRSPGIEFHIVMIDHGVGLFQDDRHHRGHAR